MSIILFYLTTFVFLTIFVGLRRLLQLLRKSKTPGYHLPAETEEEEDSQSQTPYFHYDVFLSFRGDDVRKTFMSHLNKALRKAGIKTFQDEKDLKKGTIIREGLTEAIDHSRFAIVVISKNYANSHWCLEELSRITELAKKKSLVLIPVFFEINPSDLKRQSGPFHEALENHKHKYKSDPTIVQSVEKWREALAYVGNISGWDSRSRNEESKLVEEIVQDLSERLLPQYRLVLKRVTSWLGIP